MRYEPCFVLSYKYNNESFLVDSNRQSVVKFRKANDKFSFQKIDRNKNWEASVLKVLSGIGLQKKRFFSLKNSELFAREDALYFYVDWLNENKSKLEKEGILIKQGKLEKNYFIGEQKIEAKANLKDDWFDVYATVVFGNFRFPFYKLKQFILNDIREFELPNGEVAIIPDEWFARYKTLLPLARIRKDKMQFGKYHYALFKDILQPEDGSF